MENVQEIAEKIDSHDLKSMFAGMRGGQGGGTNLQWEVDGEKVRFSGFKEARIPSQVDIFMIEQGPNVDGTTALERVQGPKVAKKVKKKVKPKRVIEYVWRVKVKNKTSNKVAVTG